MRLRLLQTQLKLLLLQKRQSRKPTRLPKLQERRSQEVRPLNPPLLQTRCRRMLNRKLKRRQHPSSRRSLNVTRRLKSSKNNRMATKKWFIRQRSVLLPISRLRRPQVSLSQLPHRSQSLKHLQQLPASLPLRSANQPSPSVRTTPQSKCNNQLPQLEQLQMSLTLWWQKLLPS